MGFSSSNLRYDMIVCIYLFKLFSQVSDVAHGHLVLKNSLLSIHPIVFTEIRINHASLIMKTIFKQGKLFLSNKAYVTYLA